METISLRHVTKTYTTYSTDVVIDHAQRPSRCRTVLRDLSVSFPIGQLSVIIGRSGCGKSTLLKLLGGQEAPDEGEVLLPAHWHSATLSPNPYVITWTSVLQNIAMAGGAGRNPEERAALAERMVRLVHLEDYADLTPMELSTGMRQRLGLARVLASQSELLLLDEPFASLDFITREELQQELLAIQSRLPRTMILVTHQLEEALLLGQHIYVLCSDGTITAFDLTAFPYPRNLRAAPLEALRRQITAACRR